MKRIGIDEGRGDLYESPGGPWCSIWPSNPMLAVASVADDSTIVPDLAHARLVFREDHFDAVTRIRRGRFYKPSSDPRPLQCRVWPHPSHVAPYGSVYPDGTVERPLHVFEAEHLAPSIQFVAIGDSGSQWRVLGAEKIISGEYLVTLKARHALGVLPILDAAKVPEIGRTKAIETYDKLVDSGYREGPGSIVDRARDAAQWFLATWWAELQGDVALLHEDLAPLINRIERKYESDKDSKPEITLSTARTIARLHSRHKPNEQQKRNSRPLMEADSEYALSAFGLLLREFRWDA